MSAADSIQRFAELDSVDREIVRERVGAFLSRSGPQVGDFVRFADGVERRISYHWTDDAGWDGGVQTSDGGRFYFGNGYCSFSGGLYPCVPVESLELVETCHRGSCWFFHHDHRCAGNGVDVALPMFNVWACGREANR